jgi:hypothetical protein
MELSAKQPGVIAQHFEGVVAIQSVDILNISSGYDFKACASGLSGKCFTSANLQTCAGILSK